jgi:endonuclease III
MRQKTNPPRAKLKPAKPSSRAQRRPVRSRSPHPPAPAGEGKIAVRPKFKAAAEPWTAAEVKEAFRRLRAANPEPRSELKYADPYTLLIAVVLSAQATDAGVNKARTGCAT